jgi:hypothetical protein
LSLTVSVYFSENSYLSGAKNATILGRFPKHFAIEVYEDQSMLMWNSGFNPFPFVTAIQVNRIAIQMV